MKYSLLLLLGLCAAPACGGEEPGGPDRHIGDPFRVILISNDNQHVRPGAQVEVMVEIRDIDERALYDSRVTWSINEYDDELFAWLPRREQVGSVTPAVSYTNAVGRT